MLPMPTITCLRPPQSVRSEHLMFPQTVPLQTSTSESPRVKTGVWSVCVLYDHGEIKPLPGDRRNPLSVTYILLSNLLRKLELFEGPKVKIFVDDGKVVKQYPKKLLCCYSKYFNTALNSRFPEGLAQEIRLDDCSEEIIQAIVSWMSSGRVSFSDSLDNTQKLTKTITFFVWADRLLLSGPFDAVIQDTRDLLINDGKALTGDHIRSIIELSDRYPIRDLIIRACASDLLKSVMGGRSAAERPPFRFRKEMDKLDDFALEVYRKFHDAVDYRPPGHDYYRKAMDPLSNEAKNVPF